MAQQKQVSLLIEEREKQILEEAAKIARDTARREMALLEFELFSQALIPKRSKEKAEKSLKKLKREKWKAALKKAKGNEEEAMLICGAS